MQVKIKSKEDNTYNLKIKNLSQEDLKVLQALVGEDESLILKRVNKYQKDIGDSKVKVLPAFLGKLWSQILHFRTYDDEQ